MKETNEEFPTKGAWRMVVTDDVKTLMSPVCNWVLRKSDGYTMMWGKTPSADPVMSPIPQILDIEVTTICRGPGGSPCSFCYKSNGPNGHNMSLDEFKKIIDKMPWLTQIALGADAQCESNPEIFDMMRYAQSKDIIPNLTVADLTQDTANVLASLCGAVAVSRYANADLCYDTIDRLQRAFTDTLIMFEDANPSNVVRRYDGVPEGWSELKVKDYFEEFDVDHERRVMFVKQHFPINVHMMISKETLVTAMQLMDDVKTDPRLEFMNSIVFLSLKEKGRGESHSRLSREEFNSLCDEAIERKIRYGFDSCTAHKYFGWLDTQKHFTDEQLVHLKMHVEPCESTLLSSYINEHGQFFPCSFTEGTEDWIEGIDVLSCESFEDDVWWNDKVVEFRNNLLKKCRNCPIYCI